MALGAYQIFRTQREISSGMRVQGVVVRSHLEQGGYYPIVRFETTEQGIIRFTDRSGYFQPEFQDGQQVEVLYPPYEPEKARIFTPQRFWFAPLVMTTAGVLPLVIGLLAVWFTERKTNNGDFSMMRSEED